MWDDEIQNIIMAVLFALPGPVTVGQLAKACDLNEKTAEEKVVDMVKILEQKSSAIIIKEINGKFELSTNPRYYEYLIKVVSSPTKPVLTDTMMETLAIVAAKKETTRVEIEKIRGAKSDFAVNKLIEYGLIEERGRLKLPGRPIVFGPTDEFYRRFGVDQKNPLPRVNEDIEKKMAREAEKEVDAL